MWSDMLELASVPAEQVVLFGVVAIAALTIVVKSLPSAARSPLVRDHLALPLVRPKFAPATATGRPHQHLHHQHLHHQLQRPGAAVRASPVTGSVVKRMPFGSRRRAAPLAATAERLSDAAGLIDSVDVFIFDCDGVIWKGDSLIPGIPDVLDKLRAAGKRCYFVTNNSTKSRKGYKGKFDSLGLNIDPEEIFSSSFAAAAYLEQTKFKDTGKKVYIIGEKGIAEELDLIGVPYMGGPDDGDKVCDMGKGGKVIHDHDVGAVIVGFDREVNYYKIQYAQLCINENPGCEFIATNLDAVTHLTDAQEWAGNGSMVGAIKGCTGKEPTVVGKPAPLMIDYLADKLGIQDRSRICMVGDRLDTDIAFGRNNGLKSVLVLSGVTSEEKVLGQSEIVPDAYCDSINDFFP